MNQIDISIIIPLYKGEKYVSYWIQKIFSNREILRKNNEIEIELIFVNDYPTKKIVIEQDHVNPELKIMIIESEYNRGIHGARVLGLKNAKGKYIVFMDQDDQIDDAYLLEQFSAIGNNDWIICNGRRIQCHKYGERKTFKDIATLDRELQRSSIIMRNPIKSPSQVLIRKEAIPQEWTDNILDKNGVDDYFLWLLLVAQKRKYIINDKLLYTHINHINNASNNIQEMIASFKQLIYYLETLHVYTEEELNEIRLNMEHISESSKDSQKVRILDEWLYIKNRGGKIEDYLFGQGINSIAIYGMGIIGERLFDELVNSKIRVKYIIDQKAEQIMCQVPVVRIEEIDKTERIDAIIVTVLENYSDIVRQLVTSCNVSIIPLDEMLYLMIKQITF